MNTRNRVHLKSRVRVHTRNRNLLRLKSKQDTTKTAVDGPNAATDNSKKIADA